MPKTKLKFFYIGVFIILLIAACGKKTSTPVATGGDSAPPPPSSSEAPASPETEEIIFINLAGPDIGTIMEWVDGSVLVHIPAGEFTMGYGGQDNPEHIVSLRDFWIYRTEVTNRMYAACVSTGKCSSPVSVDYLDPEYASEPITGIAWEDAHAYCTWIKGDLPTEAQWEKTARGPEGKIYPWGDAAPSCDLLNFDNCTGVVSDVTAFPGGQSDFEVLDMAGNVYEWVSDWYDVNYYQNSPNENPYGPDAGTVKSVRSSSFESSKGQVQVSNRFFLEPEEKRGDLGFRCVLIDPVFPAPFCTTSSRTPGQPEGGYPGGREPSGDRESCQPTGVSIGNTFCQGGSSYVNINTNSGVEAFSVAADGEELGCTQYQTGRITCGTLIPESIVTISVCGGGCDDGEEMETPSTPGEGQGNRYCMTGFTYNPETGDCDYSPSRLDPRDSQNCGDGYQTSEIGCLPNPGDDGGCAPGLYYDYGLESCVPSGDNAGDCFQGFTAYPGQDGCSNACLDGFSYDSDLGCCAPEDGGGTPEFGCGVGYEYDMAYETCVPDDGGYTYPDCSDGYYFSTFDETCMPVPGFGDQSCSEGFYYNAFEETCLPVPDIGGGENCSEGYYYDMGQESCLPVPMDGDEAYCPEEYMYDTGRETCVPYSEDGGGSLTCQSATITVIGCYEDHGGGGEAAGCESYSISQCGVGNGCYWDTSSNSCQGTP